MSEPAMPTPRESCARLCVSNQEVLEPLLSSQLLLGQNKPQHCTSMLVLIIYILRSAPSAVMSCSDFSSNCCGSGSTHSLCAKHATAHSVYRLPAQHCDSSAKKAVEKSIAQPRLSIATLHAACSALLRH